MKYFLIIFLIGFINSFLSQQELLPNINGLDNTYSKNINQSKNNFHTAVQPYKINDLNNSSITADSVQTTNKLDLSKNNFRTNQKKTFFSPIGASNFGINTSTGNFNYLSALGAQLQYSFSPKFGLEVNYKYLVSEQEKYIDSSLFSNQTIPSIGRLNLIPSQNNGLHDLQGHLTYSPNKFFSF